MSRGRGEREKKKKKNLCENGRVIRLFSMLEIAFCLQSYVAFERGHGVHPPSASLLGGLEENNVLALFGFLYGDGRETLPNAGRPALCQTWGRGSAFSFYYYLKKIIY